jgi:hypothetical protein
VIKLLNDKLATDGKWLKQPGESAESRSIWKFKDEAGNSWNGVVDVRPLPGEKARLAVTLKINR